MESIFKSFLGVFFLFILSFTGIGLVEASIEARKADSYLSEAVSQIEAAHYSKSVKLACESDALSRGYSLTIDPIENDMNEGYGSADLSYVYRVPFLGLSQTHTIHATIR